MIVIIIQTLSIIFMNICKKKKINHNHELNNDEINNLVS